VAGIEMLFAQRGEDFDQSTGRRMIRDAEIGFHEAGAGRKVTMGKMNENAAEV
jgi:hypothetical protein